MHGPTSDIISRESLENAIAAIVCSGGSTNGVLHLLAVAKEAGARVVIVNAEATAMDDLADAVLRGSISEILPRLAET